MGAVCYGARMDLTLGLIGVFIVYALLKMRDLSFKVDRIEYALRELRKTRSQ